MTLTVRARLLGTLWRAEPWRARVGLGDSLPLASADPIGVVVELACGSTRSRAVGYLKEDE